MGALRFLRSPGIASGEDHAELTRSPAGARKTPRKVKNSKHFGNASRVHFASLVGSYFFLASIFCHRYALMALGICFMF